MTPYTQVIDIQEINAGMEPALKQLSEDEITTLVQDARIGEDHNKLSLGLKNQHKLAALNMARQAARSIHLYTHDLDRPIYNNHDFVDAVVQLALRSRHSTIRILVRDTGPLVHYGHLLIEPCRRLSTYISIRKVAEEFMDYSQAFFIVDERGLMLRKNCLRYEGIASFNAPMESRELIRHFDEVWRRSEPDPRLRRLHI